MVVNFVRNCDWLKSLCDPIYQTSHSMELGKVDFLSGWNANEKKIENTLASGVHLSDDIYNLLNITQEKRNEWARKYTDFETYLELGD